MDPRPRGTSSRVTSNEGQEPDKELGLSMKARRNQLGLHLLWCKRNERARLTLARLWVEDRLSYKALPEE